MDFTDSIIKDVLLAGIHDTEIRREILGEAQIDSSTVNEVVRIVEGKETARDAIGLSCQAAALSSYKGAPLRQKGLPIKPPAAATSGRKLRCKCGNTFIEYTTPKRRIE